jgi:hypothetical protein
MEILMAEAEFNLQLLDQQLIMAAAEAVDADYQAAVVVHLLEALAAEETEWETGPLIQIKMEQQILAAVAVEETLMA